MQIQPHKLSTRKSALLRAENLDDLRARAQRRRVLVVDDVPAICTLFQRAFARVRGHEVEVVAESDAQRALARVCREAFDIVICDYRMPGADGATVLAAAWRFNPGGVRVLITGYNEVPAGIEELQRARVDAYLQKPFHAEDLHKFLFDVLNRNTAVLEEHRQNARELEYAAYIQRAPLRVSG